MSFPKSSELGEAGEAGEPSLWQGTGRFGPGAVHGGGRCRERSASHRCCCGGAAHGFTGSCLESGRSRQPMAGGEADTWQIPLGNPPAASLLPGRTPRAGSALEPRGPQGGGLYGVSAALRHLMRKRMTALPLLAAPTSPPTAAGPPPSPGQCSCRQRCAEPPEHRPLCSPRTTRCRVSASGPLLLLG